MALELPVDVKVDPLVLLMDLEGVAVPTRRVIFETVQAKLSEQGMTFDEPAMIRHGLASPPGRMVAEIAERFELRSAARSGLLAKLTRALEAHFRSGAVSMALGLDRLLAAVRETGGTIGIVSWQTEDAARALSEKVGLVRWDPRVFAGSDPDKPHPCMEVWANAIRVMDRGRLATTVLCGSGYAARSALAAGARVVVAPDEFTSHQDYGGVDAMVEHVGDLTLDHLVHPSLKNSRENRAAS